jgi:hypothetical protein
MRNMLAVLLLIMTCSVLDAASPFYVGADVSMLPEIERAGGIYKIRPRRGIAFASSRIIGSTCSASDCS